MEFKQTDIKNSVHPGFENLKVMYKVISILATVVMSETRKSSE